MTYPRIQKKQSKLSYSSYA